MKYKNFNLKKKINVFLVGDFFLDEYIFGNIFRMSPEADIPIINISNSKKKNLGGAGNVLNNLYNLGAKITPLGIVGMDKNGKYILDYLKKKKININLIQKTQKVETITKSRIILKKGSRFKPFIRIDNEKIEKYKAVGFRFNKRIKETILKCDVVIISDYGKGVCKKNLIKKIIYYANLKNKITIVDPNKGYNDYKKYEGTKFITPNLKELQLIQPKMKNFDTNVQQASIKIINRYNIKTVIATRSEKGISLIQKNKFKNFRVKKKRVYDVSGAGDTVISVLAYLLAKKIDLNLILKICNLSANNVISKSFTIPIEKNEFVKILNKTMNE